MGVWAAYRLQPPDHMRDAHGAGVFAIATSTIALRTGLLFRWPVLAGFLVGLLSLFAVGPVRTMNSGKLRYLRPNLTRRMGRQTVADGSGQSMH